MGIGPLDYGRVVACCYAIGFFDVGKLGPLNYGGVKNINLIVTCKDMLL